MVATLKIKHKTHTWTKKGGDPINFTAIILPSLCLTRKAVLVSLGLITTTGQFASGSQEH